ncbi:DUF3563 family protein [Burkholderia dolosa]|jgi:hypothetical protein|uniref:DUF3563 family protein n=1 Tax=Burkholderia dolosa TaxID=152500 RepID=A0A892IG85_9BURK|nr:MULTISPECIES: DUF3563 family protein [Burkholderia]AKE05637.1 hypothetical protein XM57_23750 [Burkholderia cepacia]AJY09563.1 hypothetical protein AK34_4340 [Burkholderia dolosa AU0158]AYZ94036.1 DUF3563 domain-containing protein [Burkholderia dolosa]ETP63685.1 hypothetical protein BDSB_17695 [Burkholderia dolosa PC543]MBR8302434.1 DUF3563 family protein [Burkholderia dolosa]
MLDKFFSRLLATLIVSEDTRRDAYLSRSADLADLERRSRYFEANHSPFSMSYDDRRRDGQD